MRRADGRVTIVEVAGREMIDFGLASSEEQRHDNFGECAPEGGYAPLLNGAPAPPQAIGREPCSILHVK
jgi:hypothetical protein